MISTFKVTTMLLSHISKLTRLPLASSIGNYVGTFSPSHVDRLACRAATTVAAPATFFDPVKQTLVPVPEEVAPLFQPIQVGAFKLNHRIVMAPLTRCRALKTVPTPAMVTYYSQRASKGGLQITEGTIVSMSGNGYPDTPGIFTQEHVKAWRPVVDAVHAKGGVFVCQLWHCGRVSHPDYILEGTLPLAPSALAPPLPWKVYSPKANAEVPYVVPHAMSKTEIKEMHQTWAHAAKCALEAGFDGVEIHGANGYLIDEFLKDGCNTRTDEYGGSIENRARFALEITKSVIDAVGDAGRVGIRLSPYMDFAHSLDSTPYATNVYLVEQLKKFNMAYVHMTESRSTAKSISADEVKANVESLAPYRIAFGGRFITCGNYKRHDAAEAVRSGHANLVAFGRPFLSSPDLPARLLADVAPNKWDRPYFYHSDQQKGYIDYPFMDAK